ncbi:hypothetical protein F4818DRAFT_442273 [Hypoxylon cercidicola]|nr:hypothetical protein F4818DRAFT_442273 [Hypoxylon cercidicola]
MSKPEVTNDAHLDVRATQIPPAAIISPILPEVAISEERADSSDDEAIQWDVEEAWEDLLKSLSRLQHDVTNRRTTAHLEETADAEEELDCSSSQSSTTPDSGESYDTSIHSAYWSEPSRSWSEDGEDPEDQKEDNNYIKEQNHDHPPHDPKEEISGVGSHKHGEIPFKDLIEPENYSNEFFEMRQSQLGGIGAFAKRDLKLGEVILVERPTLKATPYTFYKELEELAPELQAAIGRMHGHRRSHDQDYSLAIFLTNSFGARGGSCLYLIAARFNHACGPVRSVNYRLDGNEIIEFTMKKDVPAGTELTISYGPLSPTSLYSMWGFRCTCGGCRSITDEDVAEIDRAYEEGGIW